jgi:hypothetical protein
MKQAPSWGLFHIWRREVSSIRTPTGSTTRAAGGHDGEAVAPKGQGAKRRSASPSLHMAWHLHCPYHRRGGQLTTTEIAP